ncbi:XdhC family protein [Aciditerrimonas ferrireducens]|uniref:XdhC family protein n=1 Tax=Aciditerrimonas ferrireducens TaxID=667306 RepID=A0ABV6C1W9_9ACTN
MRAETFRAVAEAVRAGEPVVVASVVESDGSAPLGADMVLRPDAAPEGSFGQVDLDAAVARDALGALDAGRSTTRHYGPRGEARGQAVAVFLDVYAPPPEMVVIGAVDFTAALVDAAKLLGYRVTVCDPRPVFATPRRFPRADEVVAAWPDRFLEERGGRLGPRDAVCVLTHDHKFDVPALLAALRTQAGYVGAMGSRRTHAERVERLREAGVDEAGLGRLMAPIGLDIGARTPQETAIAICAEIIACRTGASGRSLRELDGPIHKAVAPA